MRALLQRVTSAFVTVDGETLGSIGPGFVVLMGVSKDDTEEEAKYIVEKTVNLRVFADEERKMNRSALDSGAELLVVSQFTLYADTRKGRRPSFLDAAPPDQADALYLRAVDLFRQAGVKKVATGRFQAHMMVTLCNDGPVTIMLDSADKERPRRG
ncbi:MAG: D-tyrosyl-tRNA(Tyr) deacylase [SAR202 cluster bacterium]|nr:D-tyrosyl-tRNA(Tyr) deacylase [SAR202 cluster bacterium]